MRAPNNTAGPPRPASLTKQKTRAAGPSNQRREGDTVNRNNTSTAAAVNPAAFSLQNALAEALGLEQIRARLEALEARLSQAPADDWIGAHQVGSVFKTPRLFHEACRTGQIAGAVKRGRTWLCRRSALDAYLASGRRAPVRAPVAIAANDSAPEPASPPSPRGVMAALGLRAAGGAR